TGGRCGIYDSRTGQQRHELETARDAWPRPPLALGPDRLCIVSDCCRLIALDATKGLVAWSTTLPRPSLSTVAPQLAGDGTVLLALVDGWQIERLDPWTGKSLWVTGDPRWSAGEVGEPWQPAFCGDRVCFARGNSLYAFALHDGRPLWSRALPEAARAWRTL